MSRLFEDDSLWFQAIVNITGNMLLVGIGDDDLASQLADFAMTVLELGRCFNLFNHIAFKHILVKKKRIGCCVHRNITDFRRIFFSVTVMLNWGEFFFFFFTNPDVILYCFLDSFSLSMLFANLLLWRLDMLIIIFFYFLFFFNTNSIIITKVCRIFIK